MNLEHCHTIAELQDALVASVQQEDDLPFIIGYNWDQTKLGKFPSRSDLDQLNIDKPVSIVITIAFDVFMFTDMFA